MKPHVAVIVVNYSQEDYTTICLESLAKISAPNFDYHIFLVDNGSPQPYVVPKKLAILPLTLLRSNSNLGFTGGNNLGIYTAIEKYNSQYIFLLNNDATVNANCLSLLIEDLEQDAQEGLISPLIYFSPGRAYHKNSYHANQQNKVVWYAGGCIDWTTLACFHRGVDEVNRGQFNHLFFTDFCTGCCVLIKREVLEKVGFLDKRFFVYYEDTDLSLRAKAVGYIARFEPKAVAYHSNASSSGGSGSQVHIYYQERNKLLLAWLHGDITAKKAMILTMIYDVFSGQKLKMLAVWHFLAGQFGKQPLNV